MPKARGPKAGTYKLSRCVGPPGRMPQRARRARSSLRALPAGSSRATRVCESSLAWPWICSPRTGQVQSAFRAALAAGKFAPDLFHHGGNYFQNRNVTAIVIEVPTQSIGDPAATVRAWVTVSLCGHTPEVQVSRWGLPLMTHFFITDPGTENPGGRFLPAGLALGSGQGDGVDRHGGGDVIAGRKVVRPHLVHVEDPGQVSRAAAGAVTAAHTRHGIGDAWSRKFLQGL